MVPVFVPYVLRQSSHYAVNAASHFTLEAMSFRCIMPLRTTLLARAGGQHGNCNHLCAPPPFNLGPGALSVLMRNPMDQPERTESAHKQTTPANFQEQEEERRKLRRLQIMMSMVMSVISQDADLSVEEASELAANAKRAALAMFPDKELAFDILYKPRLQRLMAERFRLQ